MLASPADKWPLGQVAAGRAPEPPGQPRAGRRRPPFFWGRGAGNQKVRVAGLGDTSIAGVLDSLLCIVPRCARAPGNHLCSGPARVSTVRPGGPAAPKGTRAPSALLLASRRLRGRPCIPATRARPAPVPHGPAQLRAASPAPSFHLRPTALPGPAILSSAAARLAAATRAARRSPPPPDRPRQLPTARWPRWRRCVPHSALRARSRPCSVPGAR